MFRKSMELVVVAMIVVACSVGHNDTPGVVPSDTVGVATRVPVSAGTKTPDLRAMPTSSDEPTATNGRWRYVSMEDGLCTDWPLFIGGFWIGTGGDTMCSISAMGETVTSPDGVRIVAANQFPPNGGLEIATEDHICPRPFGEWHCTQEIAGISMRGVNQLLPLEAEAVYRFDDRVMLRSGDLYDLNAVIGGQGVRSTWMAISGSRQGEANPKAEIWVGTEHHGLIVIEVESGGTRRYGISEGIPSNEIRDVQAERCPKICDFRDIWVATSGGVANWNGVAWRTFTVENGLPTNDVRGIVIVGRDDVWAATGAGAAHFDGQRWQDINQGIPETDLTGAILMDQTSIGFGTRGNGILVYDYEP